MVCESGSLRTADLLSLSILKVEQWVEHLFWKSVWLLHSASSLLEVCSSESYSRKFSRRTRNLLLLLYDNRTQMPSPSCRFCCSPRAWTCWKEGASIMKRLKRHQLGPRLLEALQSAEFNCVPHDSWHYKVMSSRCPDMQKDSKLKALGCVRTITIK